MEAHSLARTPGGLALPRSRKLLAALGDERLVEQLRRGNDAAFEVLYDRHHRGVLSYCRHTLGTLDEAEDALQQAFISAHADLVGSDKPIQFKAWIYTIARNRCLSMLRARREQPSDDLEVVSTAGLGDEVQQRADLQELLADVQELPEQQRASLILSELGDLSHVEVAQVIGCEASKVKSLVFQARSGLIERRSARETPCEEIREQLSTLRGGALRRGPLRRHLKACPGCSEFREEVKQQRQMFAVVLPVIPTLGLRESALAAVGLGGTTAAGGGIVAGGSAVGAAAAAKAGVAKVALIAVATGGAAVGGGVAVERTILNDGGSRPAAVEPQNSAGAGAAGAGDVDRAGDAAVTGDKSGQSEAAPGAEKSREAREDDGRGRSEEAKAEHKPAGEGRGRAHEYGAANGVGRGPAATRGNGQARAPQNGSQNAPGRDGVKPQPQPGAGNGRAPAQEPVPRTPDQAPRDKAQPVRPVAPPPTVDAAPKAAPAPPVQVPAVPKVGNDSGRPGGTGRP